MAVVITPPIATIVVIVVALVQCDGVKAFTQRVRPTGSRTQSHLFQSTTGFSSKRVLSRLLSTSHTDVAEVTSYPVTVSFDGSSCVIDVQLGESILAAMERHGRVAETLGLPEMPADCRRGNCMTCAARHASDSNPTSLERGEDGLAPSLSRHVKKSKSAYVLTCSSFVKGDGVHLELAENDRIWNDLYRRRLESEDTRRVGREAMARVIRKHAERNRELWTEETEEMLRKSGEK